MTPIFWTLACVAGMIASIPIWTFYSDQMIPGLTVPTVCSP